MKVSMCSGLSMLGPSGAHARLTFSGLAKGGPGRAQALPNMFSNRTVNKAVSTSGYTLPTHQPYVKINKMRKLYT